MAILMMNIVCYNDATETMGRYPLLFQTSGREKAAHKKTAIEKCCNNISDSAGQRSYMTSSGGRYRFLYAQIPGG